ncbi:PspC domain-containing protein [Arcanobacterium pinnipediorum]|uniref:PspC domain-containing protein n=1 Tax=Arcanobacterium pinnipediorum TaxID=1503041 RepID=A0ABY5AGM6_9ACTO|nr:PspC domain-containing protein [Arcanobacterium pinnipediorum]USR78990.1 PspC domain-containing protein [Arcanobacterium pinnipediorum]
MNIFERLTAQPLRRTSDGYLGGICAGLGHRWDISPFLLRLAVILAAFLGGIGVIAYGLAWLLLPHDDDGRIELREIVEGRFSGGFAASVGMLVIGVWYFFDQATRTHWFFFSGLPFAFLAVAGGITLLIVVLRKQSSSKADDAPAILPGESADVAASSASPASQPVPTTPRAFEEPVSQTTTPQKPVHSTPRAPRTPALSGRFILLTLALSATGAAVTLLATPNTIAAALLTLGIALSILGLGIVWAGIRGKRSSWLSFVATLLAFPVATLIGLSFIIPTSLMNAPQEQFFAQSHRTGSAAIIDNREHVVKDLTDNATITSIFSDSRFILDRNDPVILDLTILGTATIADLGGWEIRNPEEGSFITEIPELYSNATNLSYAESKSFGPIDPDEWFVAPYETDLHASVLPKKHITIVSPAARQAPDKARHIRIDYGAGNVNFSEPVHGRQAIIFVANQRAIPVKTDALPPSSSQSNQ